MYEYLKQNEYYKPFSNPHPIIIKFIGLFDTDEHPVCIIALTSENLH